MATSERGQRAGKRQPRKNKLSEIDYQKIETFEYLISAYSHSSVDENIASLFKSECIVHGFYLVLDTDQIINLLSDCKTRP